MEIEPANPDYIDVPNYNPDYVWGPPVAGYYPPLYYPPVQYGFGFDPGIYMAGFFPGWGFGFGGWGLGWGWGCGWFGGGLFVNVGFFNHWGFHGFFGSRFAGGFGAGRFGWEHDPFHRAGVPYANRSVAGRFSSSARFAQGRTAQASSFSAARGNSFAGSRGGFNGSVNGGFSANRGSVNGSAAARGFGGNASAAPRGSAAPNGGAQSFRGNSGAAFNSAPRSFAAPARQRHALRLVTPERIRVRSSAPRSSGGGGFQRRSLVRWRWCSFVRRWRRWSLVRRQQPRRRPQIRSNQRRSGGGTEIHSVAAALFYPAGSIWRHTKALTGGQDRQRYRKRGPPVPSQWWHSESGAY